MIVVIDYDLGNLRSVAKALESVGGKVEVSSSPEKIARAQALVLPGVGAFYRGMENLKKLGLLPVILKSIKEDKSFLGICLGLQLLFTESEEHGLHQGLNVIKGRVEKFTAGVKIPHMGWNQLRLQSRDNKEPRAGLFTDVQDNSYFYFVHSYYVEPEDRSLIVGTTQYGQEFVSAVKKDNVWGVQFHPEKSGEVGLKILENFVKFSK